MQRLIFLILISSLVSATTAPLVQAQNRCVDIFTTPHFFLHNLQIDSATQALLNSSQVQEAVWLLRSTEQREKSQQLEQEIKDQIHSLNNRDYTPEKWTVLSTQEKTLHKVFQIPLKGFKVVVKFGERTSIAEPLAYEIANRLGIPVPITVKVNIGGHEGSAQVFMGTYKTPLDIGIYAEPNAPIQLFDHLMLQWDRNQGNILLAVRNHSKQVAIDNEYILDSNDPNGWRQTKPNVFLLEQLPKIKKQFPQIHKAFLSPQVATEVTNLLRNSQLSDAINALSYIDIFFKTYQNVNKLYETTRANQVN